VVGNGNVEFGEECDGADFDGLGCSDLCFDSGMPRCLADCTIDTSRCYVCGDTRICDGDAVPPGSDPDDLGCNEVCDGTNLNGHACDDGTDPAESGGGTLVCNPVDCLALDRTGCFRCGNGAKDGTRELCDGHDFGGQTCASYGYTGDAQHGLLCATTCGQVIVDDCFRCGNGRLDPGEECDAGPGNGTGSCDAQCRSTCGNGVVQAPEQCDDGNRVSGDGCSASCQPELNTGGGCIVSTTGCTTIDSAATPSLDRCYASWSFGGFATVPLTNGRLTPTCRKGDLCDLTPTGANCTFGYQFCLNRTQTGGGTCVPPATGIGTIGSAESALLTAARTRFGGTIGGTTLTFAPAFTTLNLCAGVQVVVAPGTTRTVRVDTRAATTLLLDHDEVDFTCTPRFTCDPTTENCQP
jgi:cysteine-rich repeat protein